MRYEVSLFHAGKRHYKSFPSRYPGKEDSLALSAARMWRAQKIREAAEGVLGFAARSTPDTLAELVTRYLAARKPHWRTATAKFYAEALAPATKVWGDRPAASLRAPEIQAWLDLELVAGKAPRTVAIYRQALSSMFAWAIRSELMTASPMATVTGPKMRRQAPKRVLRLHELQAFLRHAGDLALFWLFLVLTGLRRSEAYRARWSWLDLEGGWLAIPDDAGKTGWANIPIPRCLADELARVERKPHGFLFSEDGSPLCHRKALRAALEAAGIDAEGIGYHTFRRTFITMLERLPGVSYSVVKLLARHSMGGADITSRYLMPPEEDLRRAIEALAEQVVTEVAVRSIAGGASR